MQPCFRTNREYESPLHEYRVAQGLTIAELTRKAGIKQQYISGLANGTISPLLRDGTVRPCAAKLCKFFNVDLEDLFPRYICSLNMSYKFDAVNYETYSERIADSSYKDYENHECIQSLLQNSKLDKQQKTMLHMYFFMGMSLREIGKSLHRCQENIRKILFKALKKIRKHNRNSLQSIHNYHSTIQFSL